MLQASKVADRPTLVSDLVKYEFNEAHYWDREIKALSLAEYSQTSPHGCEIGQVYLSTGTLLEQTDVAGLATDGSTPLYILIDDTVYFDGHADGEIVECAVMVNGPAVVAREQLKFADTLSESDIDTVVSVLESQDIKVHNQL